MSPPAKSCEKAPRPLLDPAAAQAAAGAAAQEPPRFAGAILFTAVTLTVVLIGSHWRTLGHLASRWASEPQYSHGFLVPLFALGVLWSRRDMLRRVRWQPAWMGLLLLLSGAALRLLAIQTDIEPLEPEDVIDLVSFLK